jgi:putative alpha-1,2-mannosidase
MRYPCGRIELWSIDQGELADCISRGLRLYPCIGSITNKDNSDWRKTISGDPSVISIKFRDEVPARGSSVALTVTPHVSVYRYHLSDAANDKAIVMTTVEVPALMSWDSKVLKWTTNSLKVLDDRTVEMTVSGFRKATVYYYIKFSAASFGHGTLAGDQINEGASSIAGARIGGFLKFNATEVVAAVSVSHTSMDRARRYMRDELGQMDFEAAADKLRQAWTGKLGKVEAQGPELRLRQLYTALYTVYANTIDVSDNTSYSSSQPLLSIASSDYWQYVGGYMRCSWDQSRGVYPLLVLIDPEMMSRILNTYLVQFDRDGKFAPNWDPFSENRFGSGTFIANIALLACLHGVPDVDYAKLKDAMKITVEKAYNRDFFDLGYIPIGKDKDCASHTLEYGIQLQGLALLARLLGDSATYEQFYNCRRNYAGLYDSTNKQFRAKNPDGSWGPMKGGFFEGSGTDYVFDVPQDPYGILDVYGPTSAARAIELYVSKKSDFNDYKLIYEYLPIFADRADVTQKLVRTAHIPKFDSLTMAEGLWGGPKGSYYSDNAGPLACSILGLYWIPTSGATWMITTPSVDRLIIHGKTDLTIEALNNSPGSHYISEIKLNNKTHPSYMISGQRFVPGKQELTLTLSDSPSRLGDLYLSSTDGEVIYVSADGSKSLSLVINPVASQCTAKVYSVRKPVSIHPRRRTVQKVDIRSDDQARNVERGYQGDLSRGSGELRSEHESHPEPPHSGFVRRFWMSRSSAPGQGGKGLKGEGLLFGAWKAYPQRNWRAMSSCPNPDARVLTLTTALT